MWRSRSVTLTWGRFGNVLPGQPGPYRIIYVRVAETVSLSLRGTLGSGASARRSERLSTRRSKIALLSVRVACTTGQPQRQLYAAACCPLPGARTVPTQRRSAATANEALDTAPNHPERRTGL